MRRSISRLFFIFITIALLFHPIQIDAASKLKIRRQPQTVFTRISGEVEFAVKTSGKNLSYRWYVKRVGEKRWRKTKYKTRTMKFEATANKSGRLYRCKVTNKTTGKSTYSKSARLIVTDIERRYGYELPEEITRGLLRPLAVDGYIYVSSYNSRYVDEIKGACAYINKTTGLKCFIYTKDRHIADIIVMDWNSNKYTPNNMYTKLDTANLLRSAEAKSWAGVTFGDGVTGEHFLVALNRRYLRYYDYELIMAIITHELGHCLGIAHSDDPKSIMHSLISNYSMTKTDKADFIRQIKVIKNMTGGKSGNSKTFTCYGVKK